MFFGVVVGQKLSQLLSQRNLFCNGATWVSSLVVPGGAAIAAAATLRHKLCFVGAKMATSQGFGGKTIISH